MADSMVGLVSGLYRYPVKSLQGQTEHCLEIGKDGVVGDRIWGLVDVESGRLASAKRFSALLGGVGHDDSVEIPGGPHVSLKDADAGDLLSAWLGREVRVVRAGEGGPLSYQMTFDPPNDDAELFDIPVPEGSLVDLASVHLLTTATLGACAARWPHLNWDVRRFRPNVVVDIDIAAFTENDWVGRNLSVGAAVLRVDQPTVRCAMPLRAQPGLAAQPKLFAALNEANPALPNHLGLYLSVSRPGSVSVGDGVMVA
jgi:hypothetical protein